MIIKSFKIFEELTVGQFSEEIDKYLYPFTDEGFKVENRYPAGGGISIYNNSVEFSKIKEDLLSLLSYISTETDLNIKITFKRYSGSSSLLYMKDIKMKEFEDNALLSNIKDSYLIRVISLEL